MRTTLATIKSFVRKNFDHMYIANLSDFDGMVDGVRACQNRSFRPVETDPRGFKNSLGINGAWFVFGSRDHFGSYDQEGMVGYEIYNCCGNFILALKGGPK